MKKLIALVIVSFHFSTSLFSQNVGINTTTPEAALDIYGDVIFRTVTITADDGVTYAFDINSTKSSYYRVSGPTADFTFAGIIAGIDGRTITLFNRSGFAMQLNNEDPFAALTDQIVTGTNADLIIVNKGIVTLQYDGTEEKWIVKSSSKGSGGPGGPGFWDLNGSDIYNNTGGNVGIGTSTPTTKLTIVTDINTGGWTHIGQPLVGDPVIVGEGIGGVSAAIGTSSNHALRFTTNGTGKLSIYPAGEVVIGSNATGAFGKLTVETLNNSYGISHLGEGGNVLVTRMGGTSAGIGTFSPTHMRIFCNSISQIFIAAATGNVGIGTENFGAYKLEVNGSVRSKEIVVEAGWADYVFDEKYKLPSLGEVEKFIKQNKHLPSIPSAKEIEEKGLNLGELQKKMMEKIEELTLYIIQQQKEIDALKKAISSGNK